MKKVLCALGLMFTAVSSALATTYPLTIENCGYQETFTRPPERVVALGQNTVEILLLLGLQKQVVASAFWPTSVLPQLAEQNAKIKTLTVEIPSLESVLAQNPDFVPAQLPLLLGPESKVARREDLATVGVNSYVSPGMCATKKATGDMYGSRQKLWDMTYLYQEIEDFAKIFNVEDRGQAVIADFKKREADLRHEFGKSKKERETEYMSRLDVPSCLKEDFELIVDDAFTIMGVGTVATGNILTGMCREGENACIYKANGDILETRITTVDVHTKERKANGCGYKTEHVGLGLRGVSKEQLEKGDRVIVKNANMYGM